LKAAPAAEADGKVTSKPVVQKQRLALRASFTAPKFVRTAPRPVTAWSAAPTEERITRR
jgi:hypothetical protein